MFLKYYLCISEYYLNRNFKDPSSVGDVQKRVQFHKHNMHALSFREAEFGERYAKQLKIRMELQNYHYHAMEHR
jgi:hypothetical protein